MILYRFKQTMPLPFLVTEAYLTINVATLFTDFFPTACIWALLIIFSIVYLRQCYVTGLMARVFLSLLVCWFCPGRLEALI